MRQIFFITILIFLNSLASYAQNIDLKKGLVAYYPFNGNANDESENGKNGEVYGTSIVSGIKGNCLKFDNQHSKNGKNKTDYIILPKITISDFSFCIWLKYEKNGGYTKTIDATVYSIGELNSGKYFFLGFDNYEGRLVEGIYENNIRTSTTPIEISENIWHFITCVKSGKKIKLFLDGEFIEEKPFNVDKTFTNEPSFFSYHQWKNSNNETCGASRFYGMLDEARIYNRELNNLEILALYKNKTDQPIIEWTIPSLSNTETSDKEFNLKAEIKSTKEIKCIKLISNKITIVNESIFFLSDGQGSFEKSISLNPGLNEITILAENDDGISTSAIRTIKYIEHKIPPLLLVSNINFIDENGNNRIDGNEECSINFSIENKGKGAAKNLKVIAQNNSSISGLAFSNSTTLSTIAPHAIQNVRIPINGTLNLTSGTVNIKVSFEEQMGFPPDPFELNISTKEFRKPDIKIVDNSFLTDNGSIKLGLPIQLKALVQNVGQGAAEDVKVNFQIPVQNVFPNGEKDFDIGSMPAGATKELIFEFIASKLYSNKAIPVTIKISEKFGKFSQDKEVIAEIDSKSSGNVITIASNVSDKDVNIQVASLSSDVDKNIPKNLVKYPNRYALIIGNEDYSSRQTGLNSEVNVAFAVNDAKVFKEYAINTFGIDEKNCFLLTNATSAEISQKIELIFQILSKLGESGELVFYYAGHGFPDESTKIPYLIPVDVNANNLQSAIKLSDLYSKFSQTKAKRITIYLDACFTGGGRDQGLFATRGVKIIPKKETVSGNMVVFSATSENQSALSYKDKQHGIFTYFLLKKLQDTKGDINYGDLEKYISDSVSIESLKINGKAQDPTVIVSPIIQNIWKMWKIK